MHFSKTYAQLLVTLPPEFRNDAFEYRKVRLGESHRRPTDSDTFNFQLKRLINQTALELDSLGLSPSLLRSLHGDGDPGHDPVQSEEQDEISTLPVDSEGVSSASYKHTIVYEIALNSSVPEPRLRLSSRYPSDVGTHHCSTPTTQPIYHVDLLIPEQSLDRITRALLHPPIMFQDEMRWLDGSMESYASALPWSHVSLTAVVQ